MPLFSPSTDQSDIELAEEGRYIATLTGLEAAPDRGFGPGLKWVLRLTDPSSGMTIQSRDGGDFELWQFTSTKLSPKAKARPMVEALLGRKLDTANRETPDEHLLIGRSMICMLIHEKGDDDTVRQRLVSCVPYTERVATAIAESASTQPGPAAPPTQPPPAGQGGLLDQVTNAIRKAHVLSTPRHLEWLSTSLDTLSDGDLYQLLLEINADLLAD